MILSDEQGLREFFTSGKKSVFFLHDKESVQKIAPHIYTQCVLIPTSPEALFALDALKISYRIPEEYYDDREYTEYFKKEESKIFTLVKTIDTLLQEEYPAIKVSGLLPAFYNSYSFVRIFNPLSDAYFKIGRILEKESPQQVGLMFNLEENVAVNSSLEGWLLWGSREHIFKKVIGNYEASAPIHMFSFEKRHPLPVHRPGSGLASWLQKNPRAYYLSKLFKKDGVVALKNIISSLYLKPLLLLNNGYDWEMCHGEFKKRGYYIWGQIGDALDLWRHEDPSAFAIAQKILGKLESEDVDYFPLVKEKLGLFLEKIVPACISAHESAVALIRKKKIRALLFSINPTAISKSIAHAATNAGVPVIGWQHGDMNYRAMNSIILNDFFSADFFLDWGRGSYENKKEALDDMGMERKAKVIGSASLDTLISSPPKSSLDSLGINNKKPVIVYATSMYYLSNAYSIAYFQYSDNLLYRAQRTIIGGLADVYGSKIIKLHPNSFYSTPALQEYCNSFKDKNVMTVRHQASASSLFSAADIIIIDMPTTTLLQAVTTKKPIFCLTSLLHISQKARELLAKRAVVSETPEELMEAVKKYITSGGYEADVNNTEFLESFGTLPNGKSAERAVEAVNSLILHE